MFRLAQCEIWLWKRAEALVGRWKRTCQINHGVVSTDVMWQRFTLTVWSWFLRNTEGTHGQYQLNWKDSSTLAQLNVLSCRPLSTSTCVVFLFLTSILLHIITVMLWYVAYTFRTKLAWHIRSEPFAELCFVVLEDIHDIESQWSGKRFYCGNEYFC